MSPLDVRPAASRFHTDIGWLDSWHSFSFGGHYDPTNVGHGLLLVSNDDVVAAGQGFGTHSHRDMEIVTWVLEGELAHRDSTGTDGVIYPGLAQRMSAGSGIAHSEMNARSDAPVHFVQMWVPPDTQGVAPSYEQADVTNALAEGGLVLVASGRDGTAAIHIHQHDAELRVGQLAEGVTVTVPDSPHAHVFVASGTVNLGAEHTLATGDAARLTDAGQVSLTVVEPAEVIIWTTG